MVGLFTCSGGRGESANATDQLVFYVCFLLQIIYSVCQHTIVHEPNLPNYISLLSPNSVPNSSHSVSTMIRTPHIQTLAIMLERHQASQQSKEDKGGPALTSLDSRGIASPSVASGHRWVK